MKCLSTRHRPFLISIWTQNNTSALRWQNERRSAFVWNRASIYSGIERSEAVVFSLRAPVSGLSQRCFDAVVYYDKQGLLCCIKQGSRGCIRHRVGQFNADRRGWKWTCPQLVCDVKPKKENFLKYLCVHPIYKRPADISFILCLSGDLSQEKCYSSLYIVHTICC